MLRIDLLSEMGRAAAGAYGVNIIPMTLVFDGAGQIVLRDRGLPDADAIRAQVAALIEGAK